jgi:hypothetical protein
MSRTKRKISQSRSWGTEHLYIQRGLSRFEGFEYKKVKQTEEEYAHRLRIYGHSSGYRYVKVPLSVEERIEQLKAEFAAYHRDGALADKGNKYFKYLAKRRVRMNTKKFLQEYKDKGENYTPNPSWHDGDYLAWTVW